MRRFVLLAVGVFFTLAVQADSVIRVGSKTYGESHILGELAAQLLEANGYTVERKLGLGGTLVTFEALAVGELDIYPEYTGTLVRAVLDDPTLTRQGLDDALATRGMFFGTEFGFNNSYAIAVPGELASSRDLSRISDLKGHPDLAFGFTHEFLNRGDGWPALKALYDLPHRPTGVEHTLAYRALEDGGLAATDAYTTDGELDLYDLVLLDDDRGLFPVYDAGLLTRQDLDGPAAELLEELAGRIDESRMRSLNRAVAIDGESPFAVAGRFLRDEGLVQGTRDEQTRGDRILHNTLVHLKLTGLALFFACLVAIPLALLVSRSPRFASALQYAAGLIQTIPALALLALLIPILGLGQTPAILALFLYSLLPIVRNTLAGLAGIDPLLKEVAQSMGMTQAQQLRKIELPLATPMIVAGIRTAAVISIGTATLAAFVGAGGLGGPILTGLSLSDNGLILEGAIPAAFLALAVEISFELAERRLLPAHLRVG